MKRHLLSAADLTRDDAELVLTTADEMRSLADRPIKKLPALRGRTVVNLFFEDSTRTRISFEAAAKRLSADVINFSAKGSSLSQGREPQGHRADARGDGCRRGRRPARRQRRPAPARALGLGPVQRGERRRRHPRAPDPGAARRLHDVDATWASPSRAVSRAPGRDRRRRAAQPGRALQRAAAAHARRRGHAGRAADAAARSASRAGRSRRRTTSTRCFPKADAVMMLRVQRERMNGGFFPTAREYCRRYGLDGRRMATLQDHTIVMHPGPMVRGMEITADVADSDRSVIVEQVTNGVAVRMAVLYLLLGGSEPAVGGEE